MRTAKGYYEMQLTILRTEKAASDAVSIYFERPNSFPGFKAGQHGAFSISINGDTHLRTYSFHTLPDSAEIGITVRAISGGIVSNFLQYIKPGMQLTIDGIAGDFILPPSATPKRHLIMFAGGSGITPVFSIIQTLLRHESESSVTLIYSNKTFHRIIFRDELTELARKFSGQLKVYHILTQQDDIPDDFPVFYRSRLSPLIVRKLLKEIIPPRHENIRYYLCGPEEFITTIERGIRSVDSNPTIIQEHFYKRGPKSEFDFSQLPQREIMLSWRGEETRVLVKSGQTILQAALERNIPVPFSCTEGQCGTCRARVVEGEIKLRKNHFLTREELDRGEILLCQGFPMSDNVRITNDR